MRCMTCAGKGWVRNDTATQSLLPAVPCPRCGGNGWDHCCEGSDASCEVLVVDPQPAALDPLRFPMHRPLSAA